MKVRHRKGRTLMKGRNVKTTGDLGVVGETEGMRSDAKGNFSVRNQLTGRFCSRNWTKIQYQGENIWRHTEQSRDVTCGLGVLRNFLLAQK